MKRNYLFDNLKALLIILVTIVHLLAPVRKSLGTDNMFLDVFMLAACAFHMPLFAFISGYFSKNLNSGKRRLDILVNYFVMQITIILFELVCYGKKPEMIDLLIPRFSMWYIVALFVWRYTLPDLISIKHILCWSVLLNIFPMCLEINSGFDKTLIKVVNFLCFFLLGYFADETVIQKIRCGKKRVYIAVLAVCIGSLYLVVETGLTSTDLLRSMMLRAISVTQKMGYLKGYLVYVYLFVLPVAMSIALIGLFPEGQKWYSHWGRNTMTIYLGQALLYLLWYKRIVKWDVFQNPFTAYPGAIILTVLCCLFFGQNKLADGFNHMVRKIQNLILVGSDSK